MNPYVNFTVVFFYFNIIFPSRILTYFLSISHGIL